MKLSITIVNYNQKYFPRLCVESLRKSVTDFDFEIIVCDNDSHDESIEYLRQADKEGLIRLVEPKKNIGYGAGHNFAAGHAKGDYILISNTDITVEPNTLQKMVDYMEKHKEVGMLGPKLMYHNGEIQQSCRRNFKIFDLFIKRTFLKKIGPFKKRYRDYIMADFDHNGIQEVDLLVGAFMLLPRDLYEKIGGFDKRYFMFMEDFDLCQKVHRAGKKVVYFPEAVVLHYHKRLSEGKLFKLLFKKTSWWHLSSAIKYHWKWRKV